MLRKTQKFKSSYTAQIDVLLSMYNISGGLGQNQLYKMYSMMLARAVAGVRQGGGKCPPLNFGPEVQSFDEFLKKHICFLSLLSFRMKKCFFL